MPLKLPRLHKPVELDREGPSIPWLTNLTPLTQSTLGAASPLALDDQEHRIGIGSLLQRLTKFGLVEEFRNVGQSMKMLLELALRHQKEHDQIDGLIVQRIEVHAFF